MRDPKRLDEEGATEFERWMLDAAKREAPGPKLRARMQEGLPFFNGPIPIPEAVRAAALGWKSGVAIAVVAVAAVVVLPLALRANRQAARTTNRALVTEPTPTILLPTTNPSPTIVKQPPLPNHLAAENDERSETASSDGSLKEEIQLLDRARRALLAGTPRPALAELERYDQRYARGTLRPEAIVLRIEALNLAGDRQPAKALGRQFLAQHPKSLLSDRVAAIVER